MGRDQATVDRDKNKEIYFQHMSDQTREDLGYKISTLYLTALRARGVAHRGRTQFKTS